MNPPAALAGAMGRERKPFTYTPGGLDLSEIKSERMAQRLMRNAMNQGVPETPVQNLQSPPPSATPMAMPNFNCLPVQVFPTFNLPANPKSLLRTRSHPNHNEKDHTKIEKSFFNESETHNTHNKHVGSNNLGNNNHENSSYSSYSSPLNYGSIYSTSNLNNTKDASSDGSKEKSNLEQTSGFGTNKMYDNIRPVYFNVEPIVSQDLQTDFSNKSAATTSLPSLENDVSLNEKEEVSVTKQQTKKESISTNENGDTEAAITVKLPSKKSEAKTERKVEVVKKSLPDGSVQEIKTTTTTTTIDGKTEIRTETETTTFPKESDEEEEYEVEEEEEEEEEEVSNKKESKQNNESTEYVNKKEVNGGDENSRNEDETVENKSNVQNGQLILQEEKHESSTTKKVVIKAETEESDQEIEEEYDDTNEDVEEEEVIVVKKSTNGTNESEDKVKEANDDEDIESNDQELVSNGKNVEIKDENETVQSDANFSEEKDTEEAVRDKEDEEEPLSEKFEDVENAAEEPGQTAKSEQEEEEEVEEEYEEVEDVEDSREPEKAEDYSKKDESESKGEDSQSNTAKEIDVKSEDKEEEGKAKSEKEIDEKTNDIEINETVESHQKEVPIKVVIESEIEGENEHKPETLEKQTSVSTGNIPLREPSIPLEKVEEVEIKPIGPAKEVITKTHTEIITKTTDKPAGTLSTQTQYNIVENFVTVNRTIKTLDHAYEEIPDNVSTIRTYVPPSLDRNLVSPQPSYKPYQPSFIPETLPERRHSLLLDRLSVDRQMPTDIYQSTYQSNQTIEDRQWQEPQSEVLTVSNVKPSTIIKNQQWYQRNDVETSYPSAAPASESYNNQWQNQSQYKSQDPPQQFYQPTLSQPISQTVYQTQPTLQTSPQPIYQQPLQPSSQSKPQTARSAQPTYQQSFTQPSNPSHSIFTSHNASQTSYQTPQPVHSTYQSEPQYQTKYVETSQTSFKNSTNTFQPQNTYTSKPVWTGNSVEPKHLNTESNQYSSYLSKDSSESIQNSTQQFSSSYVPPPWEQDPNYVANNSTQTFYQPPPPKITPTKEWKPAKTTSKFSKSTPTSYIPPAPNQSFVKPVTSEPSRQAGRKTYYSEYERRYISVPETTYIPHETKFQAQPDPSPQYYYDNNEPAEIVEPQWRKELREFKEQSKTTIQTEQTSVRPPWEDDPKYATPKDFTGTPSWTQTLKPRTWRERSYEPEYIGAQEWPKTNTLGRGRPQSSYVRGNIDRAPDRTRGVSVDRYNPNNYQSPVTKEHPPPASHILDPIVQGKTYHNPNVPAYHSRASAEPSEQPVTYHQPRQRESRATPVQSRSFKYLQWITGTED